MLHEWNYSDRGSQTLPNRGRSPKRQQHEERSNVVLTIEDVARAVNCSPAALHAAARRSDHDHRPQKMRIGSKDRILLVPADRLKRLQRRIYDTVLANLPIPACVFSVRGRGVIKNAEQHLPAKYVSV